MKKSAVRFHQLQRLLEEMGFQAHMKKLGWWFEHAPSGAAFFFRPYKAADRVYEHELFMVQSQLDWRGLMTAEAFDRFLTKTPA